MSEKLQTIVDQLPQAVTEEGLRRLLVKVRKLYDLDNAIYYALSLGGDRAAEEFGAMTYSPDWHARYEEAGYRYTDPTVVAMQSGFAPVEWRHLDWSGQANRRLLAEAAEFGVGNHGYSIPLHGPMGQFAMFNVSKSCTEREWALLIQEISQELLILAHSIHTHSMSSLNIETRLPSKTLSPRERDVLTLISQGVRRAQIAEKLQISENTLRVYLESARNKLGAVNTFHAVAKGVKAGIIRV
ncbi:helix-turn-helix transcriptional regulator [Oceanicella actignis]|uniref:Regulatory protein, luxR family n=1 Tax=Oceanicella actignis TaxID=1189325 RepID=A0A1M7T328_9RHOB|nr:LuxR family transcriptional regulator [Oceanicella actignis]TYO88852.1 regulatory LuxR family protein [Oceanicella actignis]SET39616.1 regulatory protein, luxR family [Oceanicella actignis]SHN65077.1 regulatory protein, luxR family [Oceanicella actignis]